MSVAAAHVVVSSRWLFWSFAEMPSVCQLAPPPFPTNTVSLSLDTSFSPAHRFALSPYAYAMRNATYIVSPLPEYHGSPVSCRSTHPSVPSAARFACSTFPALVR